MHHSTCRTDDEDEVPEIAPGEPEIDASMEPGTLPASEQDGSTEWYDEEAAAKLRQKQAEEHMSPLGLGGEAL